MRRPAAFLLLLVFAAPATAPDRARPPTNALLGLSVDLPPGTTEADREHGAAEVRGSGVSLFAVPVSWSECEPASGQYRLDAILRAVRILRQSGATVHLDLPLVSLRYRDVPRDLATVAFDDSKLSLRLGRFLDALEPALLDASTLSLGYGADTYFSDKPEELKAYRLLFDGAVAFLGKKVPHLLVGVTTAAPTESPTPAVAAALHQRSPVLFYLYAPFTRESPYVHRPPDSLEKDWKLLLQSAAGRPIAFPEVSYSSAAENGSNPERQADFVRRLRRFVASADGRALLFARYATWRDEPAIPAAAKTSVTPTPVSVRRAAFLAHRGLETERGEPKPAWREWLKAPR